MPLLFGQSSAGYMIPLLVSAAGALQVSPTGWFSGSATLHTDADGDLYVRPADWFSGSATMRTDVNGTVYVRLDQSLDGSDTLHTDIDGDLYVRPIDWLSNALTLHTDASGDLYVRPSNWFSGSLNMRTDSQGQVYVRLDASLNGATQIHLDSDGDVYVRPADWFSGAATQLLDSGGRAIVKNTGLVGGAQQADPIRFGYSAAVFRSADNTNIPSATYDLDDTAVPAGEIWVITNIAIGYTGTVPTRIQASIVNSSTAHLVFRQMAPATATFYDRQGWFVLGPGDNLRVGVTGGTAGDDLFIRAQGFRVDIDQ